MIRMFSGRKADASLTLEEAFKLLKSALIVLVILGIIAGLFSIATSMFGGEKSSQNTRESFISFVDAYESVANGSEKIRVVERMSLGSDDVLVVFISEFEAQGEECQIDNDLKLPSMCSKVPCICICNEDDMCENPYECRDVSERIALADKELDFNYGKKAYADLDYENEIVAMFGDCDGWGAGPMKVKNILIDGSAQGPIIISDNACGNEGTACYNLKKCPEGTIEINYPCAAGSSWKCCR